MNITLYPKKSLNGEICVPGDKSISHRSIMLSSIASGTGRIKNFLTSHDCNATIAAFRKMGIQIGTDSTTNIVVFGRGLHGLSKPESIIDAGNSGTTARLLLGLLSGQSFDCSLTGDNSLKKRPMKRVVAPLKSMGAKISGEIISDFLPLNIMGAKLRGIDYVMPVASAQVKSAILLATLYAESPTTITEPVFSRNHTEVMLKSFGGKLKTENNVIKLEPTDELFSQDINVPGDISSAAFFITAGLIVPKSCITILNVGLNPTRTGLLDVFKSMGAKISIENISDSGGEIYGDITVKSSDLKGTVIEGNLIPRLIDEIPIIALAATQAQGTTIIKDAQELKVKESDRILTVASLLKSFGADVTATDDGLIINGPTKLNGASIEAHMDHRIAMTAAIASLVSEGETIVNGWEWVDTSFPNFYELLKKLEG